MSATEEHRLEFLAYHAFAHLALVESAVKCATKENAEQVNADIRDCFERALVAMATFGNECGRIFKKRTGVDMAEPRDVDKVLAEIMAKDA